MSFPSSIYGDLGQRVAHRAVYRRAKHFLLERDQALAARSRFRTRFGRDHVSEIILGEGSDADPHHDRNPLRAFSAGRDTSLGDAAAHLEPASFAGVDRK